MVDALNLASYHEQRAAEQAASQRSAPPRAPARIAFRGLGQQHHFREWSEPSSSSSRSAPTAATLARWTLRPTSGHLELGGFLFLRGSTDLGRRTFLQLVARMTPPDCGALDVRALVSSLTPRQRTRCGRYFVRGSR